MFIIGIVITCVTFAYWLVIMILVKCSWKDIAIRNQGANFAMGMMANMLGSMGADPNKPINVSFGGNSSDNDGGSADRADEEEEIRAEATTRDDDEPSNYKKNDVKGTRKRQVVNDYGDEDWS